MGRGGRSVSSAPFGPADHCVHVHLPANSGQPAAALPRLRVSYERTPVETLLGEDDVLAVIAFGTSTSGVRDARFIRIGLEPLGEPLVEVWRGRGPVRSGIDAEGSLRWSSDGDYLFFAIEVDEARAGGADGASERAYREITAMLDRHALADGAPAQVLRLWN